MIKVQCLKKNKGDNRFFLFFWKQLSKNCFCNIVTLITRHYHRYLSCSGLNWQRACRFYAKKPLQRFANLHNLHPKLVVFLCNLFSSDYQPSSCFLVLFPISVKYTEWQVCLLWIEVDCTWTLLLKEVSPVQDRIRHTKLSRDACNLWTCFEVLY